MKKLLFALAVLAAGLVGQAQAALVTVPFQYLVNFSDPTVATEIGLNAGDLFSGSAVYDDTGLQAGQLVAVDSLRIAFGNFGFNNSNDLFGGALMGVGPTQNLTSLLFEALLTLGSGEYLVSFSGIDMQLTPSGDTFDFKMTATAVPLPAALPLLLAGLSAMGFVGARRRRRQD